MTDLERIGGEEALGSIIEAFVDRMFADFIIGFQFAGRDRNRIVRFETQHAARVLGGAGPYEGKPVAQAHRPLKINRGQFRRRLAILRTILRERAVDEGVIARWIAHDTKLESVITDGTDCAP